MTIKSVDIYGYTYNAENLCTDCILKALSGGKMHGGEIGWAYDVNAVIRFVAACMGIDIDDENSYDNDEFPKPILKEQLEPDERCNQCNSTLR